MRSARLLAVAVLAVLVVASMFQPVAAYVGTVDQQQTTIDNGANVDYTDQLGQTFTAELTGGLTEVDLAIGCDVETGTVCQGDPVTVQIYSGSFTADSGTLPGSLLASSTLLASAFSGIGSSNPSVFVPFTFPSPFPPVHAGNTYAIVITSQWNQGTYIVGYDDQNPYSSGDMWYSNSGSAGWELTGTPNLNQYPNPADLAFKTYVAAAPPSEASLTLTPTEGCPGTQASLVFTGPRSDEGVQFSSIPDGLFSIEECAVQVNDGITVECWPVILESACAGRYIITASVGDQVVARTYFTVLSTCPGVQPCSAVGGCVQPVNTFTLLSPWLAIVGVVGCISTIVVIAKRHRRD